MVRRLAALAAAIGLPTAGLWLCRELGQAQVWLFGAGLLGLTCLATESFVQQPQEAEEDGPEERRVGDSFVLWISPSLAVASAVWLSQVTPSDLMPWLSVATAVLMATMLLTARESLRVDGKYQRAARFAGSLVLYLLVFTLFSLVYHTKERSLFTATTIGVVALLGALETVRASGAGMVDGWRPAAMLALLVAQTTWALNYWPVSGLVGGALLLLEFYVLSGLLLTTREGALDRRVVAEYGVVSAVGLVAILWAIP